MEIFEGMQYFKSEVQYDNTKDLKQHRENIDAIFVAGIDALDVIKVKSSFSLKKYFYFYLAKRKLIKFKKINTNSDINIYQIVDLFYADFYLIKTNKFSGRQKDFVYSLNNLMSKIKNDLTENYEEYVKMKFSPTGNRIGGGFCIE